MKQDTICAVATATGGAIGIVRVSGVDAFSIVGKLCGKDISEFAPNSVHFLHLFEPVSENIENMSASLQPLDEVLLTVFRAPHSYTGEDSVEISCHASGYILKRVLELLIQYGCRQAAAGEFTQRAFLNGKLDLSQAEAVADLIAARNRLSHRMAMGQLRGGFSSELAQLRAQLLRLTSLLELELDFSDHEDLEFADRGELLELAEKVDRHILRLAKSFEMGNALKQGFPIAIVGKTNVGKSTLLNCLLKEERAIVSDIHGTTRDTIEDYIDIKGVPCRLIDTAGLRNTKDKVEQIGITRTFQSIEKAMLVVWVIDEYPEQADIEVIREKIKDKKLLIVVNKSDLAAVRENLGDKNNIKLDIDSLQLPSDTQIVYAAAKENTGIEETENAIAQLLSSTGYASSDIIISSARHFEALTRAHQNLLPVKEGLQNQLSGDLIAEDLRLVLSDLADITGDGQITSQETLSNIFAHFCVGK